MNASVRRKGTDGRTDSPSIHNAMYISLICDKSVTTKKFGIFELLVEKETFANAFLTGIES